MGIFTAASNGKFKSTKFLFAKIRRELGSLDAMNKIDEADFHLYVAEVLQRLGQSTYREEEAVVTVHNGKACLPKDFKNLYAAYKARCSNTTNTQKQIFQRGFSLYNDITCEVLGRTNNCSIGCEPCDQILQKITVRQYVGEDCSDRDWDVIGLLTLSPNVKDMCCSDSPNLICSYKDEINIQDGFIYTNFTDADIYLQYYAFPTDNEGLPMIPDSIEVEKACEWYIKKELLLNYWFDGSVADVQNKWGKAEQEFERWFAEARYNRKLPAFSTLINSARRRRKNNMSSIISQMDHNRS